jgi:DNA adenine methylase
MKIQPEPLLPFLKWAGGKRRLVPVIKLMIPETFDGKVSKFYEPFLGSGALMFSLWEPGAKSFVPGRHLVINDSNPDLILTYRVIRDDVEKLINALRRYPKEIDQSIYNKYKLKDPKSEISRAARFIFLNHTCFNGLWRVNSSGIFNVPWNKNIKPTVFDARKLRLASQRLQGSEILNESFSFAVNSAKSGDLVYFDPPYLPISKTSAFSQYAKENFGEIDHFALAGTIAGLTEKGVSVILSNSDTKLTRHIFGEAMYLHQIKVNRSISAKGSSRGKVKELLATNFPIPEEKIHEKLRQIS